MTLIGRADDGGVGTKQKAGGINWSCGSMGFRAGVEWLVHLCVLLAD